jgi:hypothetical protein
MAKSIKGPGLSIRLMEREHTLIKMETLIQVNFYRGKEMGLGNIHTSMVICMRDNGRAI